MRRLPQPRWIIIIRTNPDRSVSCFIGATEWASRTTWRVEIRLAPDKAYFTTRSWWYNDTPVEQEMYHWINAGFRAPGNLEFIFPGTHYIGHRGEYDTWPLDSMPDAKFHFMTIIILAAINPSMSWDALRTFMEGTGMIITWDSDTMPLIMKSWAKKHGPGDCRGKDYYGKGC